MGNSNQAPKLSRRAFLSAVAFGTAGVMGVSQLSNNVERSFASEEEPFEPKTFDTMRDVEIIDTDLLLIGFGNAGIAAAWSALNEGQSITVVDKGPFNHGGPSGWSWGCYSFSDNPTEPTNPLNAVNTKAWGNALSYFNSMYPPDMINNLSYQINHGQSLVSRDENGNVVAPGTIYFEQYFRREMDVLHGNAHITVYDNTMLTDFFVNGDTCLGAMGLHLSTGKFRVFRAKTTIMAAGAPVWMYGWYNTKPFSLGGIDNTGELQSAAYRHGLGIGEAEISQYDFSNPVPRVAFGVALGFDASVASEVFDKNGDPVFPDGIDPTSSAYPLQHGVSKVLHNGLGGDLASVYTKVEFTDGDDMNWAKQEAIESHLKYLNNDPSVGLIECVAEQFDKGGDPIVDETFMTELKGLFDARGAGTGTQSLTGAFCSQMLKINGAYTGYSAAQYLKNEYTEPEEIDWQPALDELARLHAIRTASVDNGIRPHEIRENIQAQVYAFDGINREPEAITAAIQEFERIRSEDLPRMVLEDKDPNCNREWKDAIETLSMLDCAEMAARATLFREESGRFMYLRPDFPEIDPAWDNCMTECRLVDGEMVVSKIELAMA